MCYRFSRPSSKIQVEKNVELNVNSDAVSALQELCMARWWNVPEYRRRFELTNIFQVDCCIIGCIIKGTGGFVCFL